MELLREGGAKEDEIAWTGVEPWLLSRGDGPVTGQEVREYLSQRPIIIQETMHVGTEATVRIRYPAERNWEVIEPDQDMLEEGDELR